MPDDHLEKKDQDVPFRYDVEALDGHTYSFISDGSNVEVSTKSGIVIMADLGTQFHDWIWKELHSNDRIGAEEAVRIWHEFLARLCFNELFI